MSVKSEDRTQQETSLCNYYTSGPLASECTSMSIVPKSFLTDSATSYKVEQMSRVSTAALF